MINANAFEAKTDNKITAITRELFVFMPKRYRCSQSVATTRPWDFLMSRKDGLLFPLRREVREETESCGHRRASLTHRASDARLTKTAVGDRGYKISVSISPAYFQSSGEETKPARTGLSKM